MELITRWPLTVHASQYELSKGVENKAFGRSNDVRRDDESFKDLTIGNIPIGDITKLTDCNYIVPLLAKSIPESMAKKFLASKGMDNALSSVVRNATVEIIDDNSFVQSLEKGLSKAICPIWSGLVGKISGALGGLGGSAASAVTGLGGGASSLLGGLFGGSKSSGDKNSNPTTTNDN